MRTLKGTMASSYLNKHRMPQCLVISMQYSVIIGGKIVSSHGALDPAIFPTLEHL